MAWAIPATPVTGNPIATSFGTDVLGDLTILETNVGLIGTAGAPAVGSSPGSTAPNFGFQVYRANGVTTDAAGRFRVIFGTPFTNGLWTAWVIGTSSFPSYTWVNDEGFAVSASQISFMLINTTTGTAAATTTADIRVLALGF